MRTANLYIRVSTDEQADKGYSQRYQEEVLRRYCQLNNYRVLSVIKEDHSAKTFNRPEWNNMMSVLKKRKRPDLLIFTKWDRFSRNTSDAYQMIRTLTDWGMQLQAIEQPLDLSVPENKMMLAFYLAIPEVENDRRALNVITAVRKAKKEGKYIGRAPIGYKNKINDAGIKFIAPHEPEASLVAWAFKEVAEGKHNVQQIWKEARRRGLECGNVNFRNLIRNPVYCGKIKIASYQDEPASTIEGLRQPIISQKVFDAAQNILNSKKTIYKRTYIVPSQLVLRGFVYCPLCNKKLLGSASTGRSARYFYYHCQDKCKYRGRADFINEKFVEELISFKLDNAWINIYKKILLECYKTKIEKFYNERISAQKQIQILATKLETARNLLLAGDFSLEEFKETRTEYEYKTQHFQSVIDKLPGDLTWFKTTLIEKGVSLLRLYDYYKKADISFKRQIIDHLFDIPIVYKDGKFISDNLIQLSF